MPFFGKLLVGVGLAFGCFAIAKALEADTLLERALWSVPAALALIAAFWPPKRLRSRSPRNEGTDVQQ